MAQAFPTRQALATLQSNRLRDLTRTVLDANPFYSLKLKEAGVRKPINSLEAYSTDVPFTTKAELTEDQAQTPPFGTNLTYPLERYSRFHQTSGTTGQPLRWLDTPESWKWMVKIWREVLATAGVEKKDRIYFAFSFGPFLGFWLAFEAGTELGALCLPGGSLSSTARLRMILENRATVLCCTPTYALRLAEVAALEKIDLSQSRVRLLMVAGEPGGSIPATRERLHKLWSGARVFDHHGMTEIGPVTYECPMLPGILHVVESAFYPEIIHPSTGQPVPRGQPGELVLTNLGRFGSPLFRYRTGDLVAAATEPVCLCGRHELALAGGILGRTDDMVTVRGVNVYPSAVEGILRQFPEIAEYQARITKPEPLPELVLRVEPKPEANPTDLEERIARAFSSSLNLRVELELLTPGALPRFEMKAQRWQKE